MSGTDAIVRGTEWTWPGAQGQGSREVPTPAGSQARSGCSDLAAGAQAGAFVALLGHDHTCDAKKQLAKERIQSQKLSFPQLLPSRLPLALLVRP